jgi:hypothetical protein
MTELESAKPAENTAKAPVTKTTDASTTLIESVQAAPAALDTSRVATVTTLVDVFSRAMSDADPGFRGELNRSVNALMKDNPGMPREVAQVQALMTNNRVANELVNFLAHPAVQRELQNPTTRQQFSEAVRQPDVREAITTLAHNPYIRQAAREIATNPQTQTTNPYLQRIIEQIRNPDSATINPYRAQTSPYSYNALQATRVQYWTPQHEGRTRSEAVTPQDRYAQLKMQQADRLDGPTSTRSAYSQTLVDAYSLLEASRVVYSNQQRRADLTTNNLAPEQRGTSVNQYDLLEANRVAYSNQLREVSLNTRLEPLTPLERYIQLKTEQAERLQGGTAGTSTSSRDYINRSEASTLSQFQARTLGITPGSTLTAEQLRAGTSTRGDNTYDRHSTQVRSAPMNVYDAIEAARVAYSNYQRLQQADASANSSGTRTNPQSINREIQNLHSSTPALNSAIERAAQTAIDRYATMKMQQVDRLPTSTPTDGSRTTNTKGILPIMPGSTLTGEQLRATTGGTNGDKNRPSSTSQQRPLSLYDAIEAARVAYSNQQRTQPDSGKNSTSSGTRPPEYVNRSEIQGIRPPSSTPPPNSVITRAAQTAAERFADMKTQQADRLGAASLAAKPPTSTPTDGARTNTRGILPVTPGSTLTADQLRVTERTTGSTPGGARSDPRALLRFYEANDFRPPTNKTNVISGGDKQLSAEHRARLQELASKLAVNQSDKLKPDRPVNAPTAPMGGKGLETARTNPGSTQVNERGSARTQPGATHVNDGGTARGASSGGSDSRGVSSPATAARDARYDNAARIAAHNANQAATDASRAVKQVTAPESITRNPVAPNSVRAAESTSRNPVTPNPVRAAESNRANNDTGRGNSTDVMKVNARNTQTAEASNPAYRNANAPEHAARDNAARENLTARVSPASLRENNSLQHGSRELVSNKMRDVASHISNTERSGMGVLRGLSDRARSAEAAATQAGALSDRNASHIRANTWREGAAVMANQESRTMRQILNGLREGDISKSIANNLSFNTAIRDGQIGRRLPGTDSAPTSTAFRDLTVKQTTRDTTQPAFTIRDTSLTQRQDYKNNDSFTRALREHVNAQPPRPQLPNDMSVRISAAVLSDARRVVLPNDRIGNDRAISDRAISDRAISDRLLNERVINDRTVNAAAAAAFADGQGRRIVLDDGWRRLLENNSQVIDPNDYMRRLMQVQALTCAERRYFTGIELVIAAIMTAAGIARVHNIESLVPNSNEAGPDSDLPPVELDTPGLSADGASGENQVGAFMNQLNKQVLRRRRYMLRPEDTLVSVAEEKLYEEELAWLILELNVGVLKQTWRGSTCIVEARARQQIELPTKQDIAQYRTNKAAYPTVDNLVTIIQENEIDVELMAEQLGQVIAGNNSTKSKLAEA